MSKVMVLVRVADVGREIRKRECCKADVTKLERPTWTSRDGRATSSGTIISHEA